MYAGGGGGGSHQNGTSGGLSSGGAGGAGGGGAGGTGSNGVPGTINTGGRRRWRRSYKGCWYDIWCQRWLWHCCNQKLTLSKIYYIY